MSLLGICQTVGLCLSFVYVLWLFIRKRKKKTPPVRGIEFALPDRENTFVRARLSTALNGAFAAKTEQKERLAVDFTQALQMLEKIKLSPLSPAEKLETSALQTRLCELAGMTLFSAKETTEINESFSRLVKLSAKYKI